MSNRPALLFANERTAAQLFDTKPAEFLALRRAVINIVKMREACAP